MPRYSLAGGGIIAAVLLVLLIYAMSGPRKASVVTGDRMVRALREYVVECRSRGVPVPPTVTLRSLVRLGHLRSEEARAFEGVELVFHTDADATRPNMILAEARMPDGSFLVLLGDGSVQQLSQERYDEQIKSQRQRNSGTNTAPLLEPMTNSAATVTNTIH